MQRIEPRIAPVNEVLTERLLACLAELDAQGETIAAAHIDAAIHQLARNSEAKLDMSKVDVSSED